MKKQKINEELHFLLPKEVKEMNLPPKSNEIYVKFRGMSDKDGWCYSTIEGLAKELNCSKTTIMLNLKILENKKIILERVVGKKGTASRFKINKFNDSTESSTECSTESSTECSTELKTFIEEVITLKMNELKNDIILELRRLFNNDTNSNDTNEIFNDSTLKEKNKKEINNNNNNNNSYTNSSYNVQEVNNTDIDINLNKKEDIIINNKENIEIDLNKDKDTSTCMYKRRKQNDYQFTVEEKDDYNPIVDNTKVESIVSKSDGNTSKSEKFLLIGSTSTFSHPEALDYVIKNDLNFDKCFKKVEVPV